ncbi:serine/threonine-protein kinase Sgk2-like [Sycon ciliatum]|uniref:serine/threonine-protein kinase Sgk2-like n=1 Tax=Sycon ciliatum TaxID=27933 RepID=UPI0031F701FD
MAASMAVNCDRVSISGYETWVEGRRFTVYKVLVQTPQRSWFVFRRYNAFSNLHADLKKAGLSPPKLPGKRVMLNNFDTAFIVHRMDGLNTFLVKLFKSPKLSNHAIVREFLALDNPRSGVEVIDERVDESEYKSAGSVSEEDQIDLGQNQELVSVQDFKLLKVIGKGNFGKVLLAQQIESGEYYAIKVLAKTSILRKNKSQQIMAERNVLLHNARHPFLVGLHSSFQSSKHLFLVLDYVNGGELFYHLQREQSFSEPRSRFYAAEISSALGYLHSMNIIYRDLKPENILLDAEGHIKITDFGLCKEGIMDGDTTGTFCGTPEYLAPEVLQKKLYTKAVDWWCLGCVLHEMLFGLPPWYSTNLAEMYNGILTQPLRLKSTISANARTILRDLLEKDPEERLGYKEGLQNIMSHVFFDEINWPNLYERKIPPPWNPSVHGSGDTTNISNEFTCEHLSKSITETGKIDNGQDDFAGFSYRSGDKVSESSQDIVDDEMSSADTSREASPFNPRLVSLQGQEVVRCSSLDALGASPGKSPQDAKALKASKSLQGPAELSLSECGASDQERHSVQGDEDDTFLQEDYNDPRLVCKLRASFWSQQGTESET